MAERHQNSTGELRAEATLASDLLIERTRAGLWIMLVALAVLWVTDVALDRRLVGPLTVITLFQAGWVALGFLFLRRARRRAPVATISIVALAGVFLSGVVSDVITNNPQGTGLSALVTCMISATLMPWGMWFQLATVLVTAVPGALSVWFCTGSLVSLGYAVGPGSIVLLASISVANAFERARLERGRVEAELRLLQSVSLEVGAAPDPESALQIVLQRICEAAGWILGQAWMLRPDTGVLECRTSWSADVAGAEFHAASLAYTFAPGVGLPGRVLETKKPAWITDVRIDPGFPRAEIARRLGLSGGMGIPVMADGEVIVVLEFFLRQPRGEDARLMHLFAGAAVQLGAVIQRKRAERVAEEEAQAAAALVEVGQTLSAHLGQPDMLARVATLALGAIRCDFSATFLWSEVDHRLTLAAAAGLRAELVADLAGALPAEGFGLTDGGGPRALVEIPSLVDAGDVPPLLARLGAASLVYVLLRLGASSMGLQIYGYHSRRGSFAPQQRRLATGVADATAIAVANARLIDDLQASSRLKSEFVATMSHELRTPLNIIVGYSDMLAEGVVGALGTEQRDMVARVQRAGVELLDLVNATLDMGRIEAGRDTVVRETVDLNAIFRQLDIELGPLVATGVTLRWQNLLGDDDALVTDKTKLKTILKNLVGNALKFTTQGSVDVLAHWEGDLVRFEVRDTGIGIAPESLPVIFEMFRQGDGSSTRTFGGVGLGLHIVRRLVDLLGGHVSAESTVGRGSTFVVTWSAELLPREGADPREVSPPGALACGARRS